MVEPGVIRRLQGFLNGVGNLTGADTYPILKLVEQLEIERKELQVQLDKDSYKGVNLQENRIIQICNAIKELRHEDE